MNPQSNDDMNTKKQQMIKIEHFRQEDLITDRKLFLFQRHTLMRLYASGTVVGWDTTTVRRYAVLF